MGCGAGPAQRLRHRPSSTADGDRGSGRGTGTPFPPGAFSPPAPSHRRLRPAAPGTPLQQLRALPSSPNSGTETRASFAMGGGWGVKTKEKKTSPTSAPARALPPAPSPGAAARDPPGAPAFPGPVRLRPPRGTGSSKAAGTHLHALLAQANAAGQALARAHVGVLVLHEERFQRLQLLLAEDGAVAPRAPLWARAARVGRRPGAPGGCGQGQGRRGPQPQRPRQPRACGTRAG